MKKVIIILLELFFIINSIHAQQHVIFTFSQTVPLIADAGDDIYVSSGNSDVIGGLPAASGGTLPYSYSWTPGTFLNDSLIANPTVIPLYDVVYVLVVSDNNNCTATDTVVVNLDSLNSYSSNISDNTIKPEVFYNSETKTVAIYFNHKIFYNNYIHISFSDITGKTIFNNIFQIQNDPLLIKDINKLPDIFIVTISSADFLRSYKIITK